MPIYKPKYKDLMLSQQFIEEMKQKLLAAKKKLQEDLKGLVPHQELGEDLDSSAQEVEDDEVSQDVIARVKMDLEKINKALAKIENGTYGTDDDGNPIAEERLGALPWADKAI
jgi:RNA polymerase-binding transcription factor DksA